MTPDDSGAEMTAQSCMETVADIIAGYDTSAPLAEASTIPAPWYVDARIAELERQAVFSRSWQVMGRVDQVAHPGQFVKIGRAHV